MRHRRYWLALVAVLPGVSLLGSPAGAATATKTYTWGNGAESTPTSSPVTGEIGIAAGNLKDVAIVPGGTLEEFENTSRPSSLTGASGVTQVVTGDGDFAALASSGNVWVWGKNIGGDLGTGNDDETHEPVELSQPTGVVQLAEANLHTFALTASGEVWVWGSNADNAIDEGSSVAGESVPVVNEQLTDLTGGSSTGVMLTTGPAFGELLVDGSVYSWGENDAYQCGCGATGTIETPLPVTSHVPFVFIDAGGDQDENGQTLALDENGDVWCWGDNSTNQCGVRGKRDIAKPVEVPGLPDDVVTVRAGGLHSLALDASGNVWAWGDNSEGQVGNGSEEVQPTPTIVLTGMSEISAGAEHSLAANP